VYPAPKTLTTTRDRPPINNTRLRNSPTSDRHPRYGLARGRASGVASRFRRNLAVVRVEEALEQPTTCPASGQPGASVPGRNGLPVSGRGSDTSGPTLLPGRFNLALS